MQTQEFMKFDQKVYVIGAERAFIMNLDEYKIQRLMEKKDQNPHPRESHWHKKLSRVGKTILL